MFYDEIVSVIVFATFAVYALQFGWNMSGIAEYELADIEEEFEKAPAFLRPLVVDAMKLWRRLLRILPLFVLNLLILSVAYQLARRNPASDAVWQSLLAVGVLEWGTLISVTRRNRKKYRVNLEECRMFFHPSVKVLEGTIEDRPTYKNKGNHLLQAGRIIRVLLQAGAYQDLFLPLPCYSSRRVEESQKPVKVFYLPWEVSGYRRDAVFPVRPMRTEPELDDKSQDAIGVYLGFRHDPELLMKEAVWTQPVDGQAQRR